MTILLFPAETNAQQLVSDSLKSLIPTMQGKDLSNLLLDIGTSTLNETGEPDSLYFYSLKALRVARSVKDRKFELYSLKFISTSRALNQQYEEDTEEAVCDVILLVGHLMYYVGVY